MDMESAHGVHDKIHSSGGYDDTNRISHAPFISTNHLIKTTIPILDKDVLK